jgi:hypothetical protein
MRRKQKDLIRISWNSRTCILEKSQNAGLGKLSILCEQKELSILIRSV